RQVCNLSAHLLLQWQVLQLILVLFQLADPVTRQTLPSRAQHFPPLECMWKGLWRRKTARRDGWVDVAGKALLPGRQAASPNVRSGMATCNHCGARISIHVS